MRERGSMGAGDDGVLTKELPQLPPSRLAALGYCLLNISSSVLIVFANKMVLSFYNFKFVFLLTWIHTAFTCVGMHAMAQMGFFTPKRIPAMKIIPLALGFVGYVVLSNMSLSMNSVGLYQILKIATAPTVVAIEFVLFKSMPSRLTLASVLMVCAGVAIATVTDTVTVHNMAGLLVALASTLVTALYLVWAGSKQKELQANSSQLLHAYAPHALWLLGICVLVFEPLGFGGHVDGDGTLMSWKFTPEGLTAIIASAFLGFLISLSTFLVIGATSSLAYNIVGHLKTVVVLTGGVMLFGDSMSMERLAGVLVALGGIVWYSQIQLSARK